MNDSLKVNIVVKTPFHDQNFLKNQNYRAKLLSPSPKVGGLKMHFFAIYNTKKGEMCGLIDHERNTNME